MRNICAIKGKKAQNFFSDDPAQLEQFAQLWNQRQFDIYDCVAELTDRKRSLETVKSLSLIHVDIDMRALETDASTVLARLKNLLCPVEIRASGGGFHVILHLKEPVEADTAEFDRANAARTALTYLLGGDPMPNHAAALLRRPGTQNFKYGEPRLCRVIQPGAPVDLTEIETLLDYLGDAPLFVRKADAAKAAKSGNGHDTTASPRVDFAADLATMRFEGGDGGIHMTQLRYTASRLRAGQPVEDVVAEVLTATRQAVAGDPRCAAWDWAIEERDISRMCFDLINKERDASPEFVELLPERFLREWRRRETAGEVDITVKWSGFNGGQFNVSGRKPRVAAPHETAAPAAATPRKSRIPKIDCATFELPEFVPFNPADLPPRDWLFGRHLQRGSVSGTVAHGGRGKTTLNMVEAVSMATGRNLLGELPKERLRVWFHNGEDDIKELYRRLAAVCQHYAIDQEELRSWLYLTNAEIFPLRVASGNVEFKMKEDLVELLHRQIHNKQIDVALFDPLVSLHGVPENDAGKMDQVLGIFRQIASVEECGIDLSAHVRKHPSGVNGLDHTGEDLRGNSAQFDAMRAVRVLNIMTEKDAEDLRIPTHERSSYIRVDKAKGKNAPRASRSGVNSSMSRSPIATKSAC